MIFLNSDIISGHSKIIHRKILKHCKASLCSSQNHILNSHLLEIKKNGFSNFFVQKMSTSRCFVGKKKFLTCHIFKPYQQIDLEKVFNGVSCHLPYRKFSQTYNSVVLRNFTKVCETVILQHGIHFVCGNTPGTLYIYIYKS